MDDEQSSEQKERIEHARSHPPIRGQRLWRIFDALMIRLDRFVESWVPERYNPFAQTGAIATTAFLVSAMSGIFLLIWYRPSVHQAYESVMAMEAMWIGSSMRSLHRYSSDVCLLFAVIHGLRLFFAGRFTGARWWAWVTGVGLIAVLWLVGWTGYLLVWDEPAQLVAQGTALVLDAVPIFAEPVSRSFLADELVPSLIFFVVFFTHMLMPLVMAAGLWLHVGRVQRPKVLTSQWMTVWVVGTLMVISVVIPAPVGAPADLGSTPDLLTIDIWYLGPLWLTDRLSSGLLWLVFALGTTAVLAAPWGLRRKRPQVASIRTSACNGCTLCARDCPYDAIVMVPRDDDRRYELVAKLDPDRCVGCGVCAGACNPGGIGLDWLPVQAMRKRFDDWIDAFIDAADGDEGPVIAFLCADSAGADLVVDRETGRCDALPGYRVVGVPCTGWVHPLTVERALRRGAAGVLVVGCRGAEPHFREGDRWTEHRLVGTRKPKFRRDKVEGWRVCHITYDRTCPTELKRFSRQFRAWLRGESAQTQEVDNGKGAAGKYVAGLGLAACIGLVVVAGSTAPYPGPPKEPPQWVVSVNHRGALEEECEPIPPQERAQQPAHMQRDELCERRRSDVMIELLVDNVVVHRQSHSPRGVTRDGPAVTLDSHEVPTGLRDVEVRIADTQSGDWTFEQMWTLPFETGRRQVILFDTREGFRHFGQPADSDRSLKSNPDQD